MYLKLDAKVYTDLDGKHVGKLHFVALDPKTHNLDGIVVERGLEPHYYVVVDAKDISEVTPDGERINLKLTKKQVVELPNYVEAHTVVSDINANVYRANEPGEPPVSEISYGPGILDVAYAPVENQLARATEVMIYPSEVVYPADSAFKAELEVEYQQQKLVPLDAPHLRKGMKIEAKDGQPVGHLNGLYFNHKGKFNEFTAKDGFLFAEEITLPAQWIGEFGEKSISLNHTQEQIESLVYKA
jgi:uncharacterized protein YrrD